MSFVKYALIFLTFVLITDAGYNDNSYTAQSDVEAPAYIPAYLKNKHYGTKTASGTKNGYVGSKTKSYSGTKTKTSYAGTKTGYAGTKTGYSQASYTGTKTWNSGSGSQPNYELFRDNANKPFEPICEPDCQNNGICVDTGVCHCPANFYGHRCQFEKKPCLTFPPLPMNSKRKCSSEFCSITCAEGHQFIDGTTVANMKCIEGQWQPTRADFTAIPDCYPTCNPPCGNGGVCLSLNTCQCPQDYRGPQCQYAASVCDVRKLGFNGAYQCFGDGERFSCKLSCPSGAKYTSTLAPLYTCLYASGIFEPQPIPRCQFESDVVIITPSSHHNYNMSQTYYETHYESSHGREINKNNYGSYGNTGYGHVGSNSYGHGTHNGSSELTSFGQIGTHQVVIEDLVPKSGTCFIWAGYHYKTFDGKIYSFRSSCQHILVRDAKDHKFTVAVKQGACKRQFYCPSELTIFLDDKQYILSVGEEGGIVLRTTKRLLPIPATLEGIRVTMPRDTVFVTLDSLGLNIKWDANNQIIIEASVSLWNNTEGLCGRLDGLPETDLLTKEGNPVTSKASLASSWQLNKIGDLCESSPSESSACKSLPDEIVKKAKSFCVQLFSKEKFRKCSKVMDVSLLLEACQWDYCACNSNESPEECACSTVSVYAKECLSHGIEEMKSWRDANTCPFKCPEGKIYKSCGPDTQASCASPLVSAKQDNTTCVEGCFCPEGLLLEEGRCVPKEECPCRLRAKSFPPGSTIPKDCNTCKCESGVWVCTQIACGARCGAVGDPHYITFDGLRYDFMGHCTYTLLQNDNVTVEVENVACSGAISEAMNLSPHTGSGKPSCTKAVSLKYGGADIHLKQGGFILVNGKEVSALPVHVGKMVIRAASSLFIIVQLPNGVDLWWDGNTRVFVDVPPNFQDKTKGLCGTFNLNQKDDFLTPEGDVEQTALAFANKWKTREFCDDVQMTEPEHPCKANIENKETAEKYCSKLKSKLFDSCRWFVDVEPYYEECLYDLCACDGDVSGCLCPILGDYAMACAKSGIHIQWRYNVKECELSCTGGQEYTVCADSCRRSCSDLALLSSGTCKPCCVEGCACAPGYVLDENNECVPVGMCPCHHKGLKFNSGYKEVRPGTKERELCTCIGAIWECKPATDAEIIRYPPAEDLRYNCSVVTHHEFTTCELAEPLTCKNMHQQMSTTTAECRPGCQCKKGYVLDTSSKQCVLPTQCPCHHGGQSYPDGHKMKEECNTCECKQGNWTCTQLACAGVCSTWGDSHFTTFDGKEYDFEGVCTYLMAKGVMETGKDGFGVEIQNVPCGMTGATCSKSVILKVGNGDQEEVVTLNKDAPLPEFTKLKRIKLRLAGNFVFLDVPSLGMSVQWDKGTRVYVKLEPMWSNRVKGLCGNYNMDVRDDFQTPSGGGVSESSALIFADSWKLKQTCPKTEAVRDHCEQHPERKGWATTVCGELKRFPFTLCHSEVPPSEHVQRCELDACACDTGDDCACACAALAAYAQQCVARGVVFKWRKQELCPMQCDEECSNYDACISACPPETCDNTLDYSEIKRSCDKDNCVEGCKPKQSCPEGTVYSNYTHIECVPRSKCRPTCMTLDDGRIILEGDVIEEDACHTCTCSQKARICTGQPCTTELPMASTQQPRQMANEPLKCVTGWTSWVNKHAPDNTNQPGKSLEIESLPSPKDMKIGSPMCENNMMTKIECRTVDSHTSAKETGLDAECSLVNGLLCKESGNSTCPDFEIRVFCQCLEEPFQCLNSTRPNYPHPTDCHKFYECTPEPMSPTKPHAVLKTCGDSMMYNPVAMVCDWPHSVALVRPECGDDAEPRSLLTTVPISTETPTTASISECPPGQVLSKCAYPCNKLCDYYKNKLMNEGKCLQGQDCVEGCIDKSIAELKCDAKSFWRDIRTCVPAKDCTCYGHDGKIVKPNGIEIDGCMKCQCLNNKLHCDQSECVMVVSPMMSTPRQLLLSTEQLVAITTTTPAPVLIVRSTVSPPPECSEDRYKNILWDRPSDEIKFTSSSFENMFFEPKNSKLNGGPKDSSAGSWKPDKLDQHPYIQVELPFKEPVYGVLLQGSPIYDHYVTSYEIMYGDDGHVFDTVNEPNGNPKIFRGAADQKTIVKQMIEPPIEAKFIRIRPLTWHEEISLRFDLIGCEEPSVTTIGLLTTTKSPQCTDEIGLEGGLLVDNIEVSSQSEDRKYLDLKSERGWKPLYSTPGEWIMWDLTGDRNITGITTKGGPDGWVTGYKVMYTSDLNSFKTVSEPDGSSKLFPGNFDKTSLVSHSLNPPLRARYFKILPITWHNNIEIRAEPIGCFEPYVCVAPIGLQAGLPEEQIEVSSNSEQRNYLSLSGDRGWRAQYNAPGEWIMWDFTGERNITGVKTKGGPDGWVTGYNLMYSSDLNTFYPVSEPNGSPKLFPGNVDSTSVVTHSLKSPLRARYFKILPITWHNNIEIRAEPIGCFKPYVCVAPIGLQAGLPEEQIEVSSNSEQRHYLSLSGDRGWRAQYNAPGEWIMWDLSGERNITGVKTKGGPDGWVTGYHLMYSSDLNTFYPVSEPNGSPKLFSGNVDSTSVVTHSLNPPLRARYFKILPITWHNNIDIRAEPLGCFEPNVCVAPIGLQAGLPEEQIEVSSNSEQRNYLSLSGDRGWRAQYNAPGEWIMWDLSGERNITGVKTKGGPDGWVTGYHLMYSSDLNTFYPVSEPNGSPKLFPGNVDSTSVVTHSLKSPLRARYFKILPITWHNNIEIRAEPLGCFEPNVCVAPIGLQAGLPEEQIEVSSSSEQRRYLSLSGDRGWRAQYNAPGEWIMWDLSGERNITGVKTKGGPDGWVTGYHLMYSSDLNTFYPVSEPNGSPKLFPGNVDSTSVVTHSLKSPLRARYFKILPITWHNNIEIRAEPLGCFEPNVCVAPIGLQAGLPEEQIEVSSSSEQRRYLSLSGDRGWRAQYNAPGEWIMWDLSGERNITGVKTKGGPDGWVTGYHLMYSSDLNTFYPVSEPNGSPKLFPGNVDSTSVVTHSLKSPLRARYFKILPITWHNNIEIRAEPLGCFEPNVCVAPIGLQAGLPEEQIEVSSGSEQRRYLSLSGDRGWRAQYNAPGEWIMWDFTGERNITGVKTKGGPDGWVTGYHLMYSSDLNTFHAVSEQNGSSKLFSGNVDGMSVVINTLKSPIHARYFKVLPITWHNNIEIRAEPVGCFEPYSCVAPLGIQAGLPVDQIEVSSNADQRRNLNLNADHGWRALYNAPGEWILWDLTGELNITGFKTMGGPNGWVTEYNVMHANDLNTFLPVTEPNGSNRKFTANKDSTSVVVNTFDTPLRARYIKLLPLTWHNNIEVHAEPIGCFEPYPETLTASTLESLIPTTPTTASVCQLCPHVLLPSSGTCDCAGTFYFDGEGCSERAQCPCVVGYMSYAVGSTFRKKCDECVCKLGGLTDCKPMKECKCAPDLVPKLSDTCECLCNECPTGSRICPTSHTCLDIEKWCDGLEDCPDDERDCTTSSTTPTPTTVGIMTSKVPTLGSIIEATTRPPKIECPKVDCPPGYFVRYSKSSSSANSYRSTNDNNIPPPRARKSYQRFYKGGSTKTGSSSGYTKTGFTKTGFGTKGGSSTNKNQAFTLDKPTVKKTTGVEECVQFKCIPNLPPLKPGVTAKPVVCSVPECPPKYSLVLDTSVTKTCPQYVCVPPPEKSISCNVMGRTFNTFDGNEYKYDICFHILARDNRFDAWTILVRKKCTIDNCANELIVRQDDELIVVKPNLIIEYNNYEYTYEQTSMICFQKNSFDIRKLGNGLAISSRRYKFSVFYYNNGDVKIGVSEALKGTVDGLCGAFDGDAKNDRRLPNGHQAVSIDEFGRSWAKPGLSPNACQTKVIPPEKQRRAWELCEVITKEPLSRCEKILNLDKWRNICLEKICECADIVVNGTKKSEEECRCELLEQFIAECMSADKDVDIPNWRIDVNCPADCPPPLVHYDCYRMRCEPTCSELGTNNKLCPVEDGQCFPGCYCPPGKLRKGQECVTPTECRDCVCNGASRKYVTFERDDLPFGGNCTYIAAQDRNVKKEHKFQVLTTNGPCKDNHGSVCTTAVYVLYFDNSENKNVLHIQKDNSTKKLLATINGDIVSSYPIKNKWMSIKQLEKKDLVVFVPDAQLEVYVSEAKFEFTVRVPSYIYTNGTEGLCGVCAGYQEQLYMQNGTATEDVDEYGDSWLVSPETLSQLDIPQQDECGETQTKCIASQSQLELCYNVLNKDKFGLCHPLVDPQSFVESCQQEICQNNKTELCTILERYATECRQLGVCLNWRTADMCPLSCKSPLVYRSCIGCEDTCTNYEKGEVINKCDKPLSEGCYCAEGKVRVNNTCIEPSKCFPCDVDKMRYAGDEWKEGNCKTCTCRKLESDVSASVICTEQICLPPTCQLDQDLIEIPKLQDCCPQYDCVPKPQDNPACEEPKKLTCGHGQVLKQKTTANGCNEFVCECKPRSECDPLPSDNEVSVTEPGMERVIDNTGCCPIANLICKPETCPEPEDCQRHYIRSNTTLPGYCCPQYSCALPKDKCVVTLEWEASSKGGEVPRTTSETVLQDLGSSWVDGPCRSCQCEGVGRPAVQCYLTTCHPIISTDEFILEPHTVPFACCPVPKVVACREGDNIYKVGEKWTSSNDPCVTYKCVQSDDKLEKITTVKSCENTCQTGWEYTPATEASGECCGKCTPVACIIDGVQRKIGEKWTSIDYCINYTCIDINGTLQVQSSNETCPEQEQSLSKRFLLKEEKTAGKCCKKYEPIACRVNDVTYPEGTTWQSDDPCKNITCARDDLGKLNHIESFETCKRDCNLGFKYREPSKKQCCGHCIPFACVVDGVLKLPDTTWTSSDNCTTYSCISGDDSMLVTSSRASCPRVDNCDPDDLYDDGCCQHCKEKPQSLSTCNPEPISTNKSRGILKIKLGHHGICVNESPLDKFKECRGSCMSGTLYNNQTGSHDSKCECCQALKYEPLLVELKCADGSTQQHRIATPVKCSCQRCGDSIGKISERRNIKPEFPNIDARFKDRKH